MQEPGTLPSRGGCCKSRARWGSRGCRGRAACSTCARAAAPQAPDVNRRPPHPPRDSDTTRHTRIHSRVRTTRDCQAIAHNVFMQCHARVHVYVHAWTLIVHMCLKLLNMRVRMRRANCAAGTCDGSGDHMRSAKALARGQACHTTRGQLRCILALPPRPGSSPCLLVLPRPAPSLAD